MNTGNAEMMMVEEFQSYAFYVLMQCQLSGCLSYDGHKPTPEERKLCEEAKAIADRIVTLLSHCTDGEVVQLLETYDLMYRIGHGAPAPQEFVRRNQDRIFDAWCRCDKQIPESAIAKILQYKALTDTLPADQHKAYEHIRDKWISTLKRHAYFSDTTTYENYQRLALMMSAPLSDARADQLKQTWYERNRIADLTTVTTRILESYRHFNLGYISPAVPSTQPSKPTTSSSPNSSPAATSTPTASRPTASHSRATAASSALKITVLYLYSAYYQAIRK